MKTNTKPTTTWASAGIAAALAFAVMSTGCGSDTSNAPANPDGGMLNNPFYALPTQIYSADFSTSTSFVPLVPSLDVDRISLDAAREVDGRASVDTVGDWLFIASSGEPTLRRYEVGEDGSLAEAGSLSFLDYAIPYLSIDAWSNEMISSTKAYMLNGSDGSHIIWNPTTMEIEGEIPAPGIVQEGYQIESSPSVVRGNRMYKVFTLINYETWEFLTTPMYLAIYDTETDELVNLVQETRCPQLYSRPFMDENNDIYFSGFVWTVGETLVNDYPKSCALRVLDGADTFDPSWVLTYADDVTDGREAGVLRYLGNGQALLDVFHDEEATIGPAASSAEVASMPHWRVWSIDLEAKAGAPVDGLGFKAPGYSDEAVDGRTLLLMPNDTYSETTAYDLVDGAVVEAFEIQGFSYHLVRVR